MYEMSVCPLARWGQSQEVNTQENIPSQEQGAWLAQSGEHVTLDLGVVS